MAPKWRKHNEEFKRDAVALSFKSDKSMTEIADNLAISSFTEACWPGGVKSLMSMGIRLSPVMAYEN